MWYDKIISLATGASVPLPHSSAPPTPLTDKRDRVPGIIVPNLSSRPIPIRRLPPPVPKDRAPPAAASKHLVRLVLAWHGAVLAPAELVKHALVQPERERVVVVALFMWRVERVEEEREEEGLA